jgi:hypothetical protein
MNYMKLLAGAYLGVAVLTLGAIIVLRNDTAAVNDAVWVRATIVVASATLMFVLALRASYRRIRILSTVMVVAIAVIVALPGMFPLWMKIDQVVCGLLLVGLLVSTFRWTGDRSPARL